MIFISLWIQKINQNVPGPLIKWLRIIGMFALYLYRLVFLFKKNSEDDQIGLFLHHVKISYGQSFLHIVSLIFSKCLCYKLHSYQYWAFWIGIRISAAVITTFTNNSFLFACIICNLCPRRSSVAVNIVKFIKEYIHLYIFHDHSDCVSTFLFFYLLCAILNYAINEVACLTTYQSDQQHI